MDAIIFQSKPIFHLPSLSSLSKPMLGRSLFYGIEVVDRTSFFALRSSRLFTDVLAIRSDGDGKARRYQKSSGSGRTPKGDGEKSASSSNQEEIISLFKRIQSSITKIDSSITSKKRSTKVSEDDFSADSVLDVLGQSRSRLEGKTADKDGDKRPTRRRGPVKKEQKADSPSPNSSLTRPPSSFVKKSPISSPTIIRERVELKSESPSVADDDNELVLQKDVRDMKLVELKELAKSRGIKGYSKLKKNELVELLISS